MDLQCLLMQRQIDLRHPACMRLVLLDMEILESNEVIPGTFRRQAYWLPQVMTRLTLFRVLSLEHYLQQSPERCHLWLD